MLLKMQAETRYVRDKKEAFITNIELDKDKKEVLIKSIQVFFLEELDEEISDFKASLVLDFMTKEAGIYIYNQALSDAHQLMTQKTEDIFSLEKRITDKHHMPGK